MLEDDFNDVLGKAIHGLSFDVASLNLDPVRLRNCLNGKFDADIIRSLAPPLNLNTKRLLNLPHYNPEVSIPAEVKTFTSPFGHLGVNAFTIETEKHILIFDTGTDAQQCINYLSKHPQKEKHLFITHGHYDHTDCEPDLAPYLTTSQMLEPKKSLTFGKLTLTTLDVAGHLPKATAYLIKGLDTPLCIIGDAIFAGSIGKVPPNLYQQALSNIRENILTLPPETLILNGHGPATSIGLEIENNPFL
ncbi:MAG: MBL fold metallo-hydrolase [Akkermansiaceae bacterium]